MQTGGLAFSERRDVHAGYDHVPYLWIHGHHPHKMAETATLASDGFEFYLQLIN